MVNKKITMTKEGYDKLVEELKWREGEERERIKSDIVTARGFGDLSENAEYDAARTAQAQNESRVSELKAMIENADVREVSTMAHDVADIGSTVKVYDNDFKEEITYRIVGSNEADVTSGRISDVSPVGKALIGHRAGDQVTGVVEESGYAFSYKVLAVTRD